MKTKIVEIVNSREHTNCFYTIGIPDEEDVEALRQCDLGLGWRIVASMKKGGFCWTGFLTAIDDAWRRKDIDQLDMIVHEGLGNGIHLDDTDYSALIALSGLRTKIPDAIDIGLIKKAWSNANYGNPTNTGTKRKTQENDEIRGPCSDCGTTKSDTGFLLFDKRVVCRKQCQKRRREND
jgi:hypothetical protein